MKHDPAKAVQAILVVRIFDPDDPREAFYSLNGAPPRGIPGKLEYDSRDATFRIPVPLSQVHPGANRVRFEHRQADRPQGYVIKNLRLELVFSADRRQGGGTRVVNISPPPAPPEGQPEEQPRRENPNRRGPRKGGRRGGG